MSLHHLPAELLLIADYLTPGPLPSLLAVCHSLRTLLTPLLIQHAPRPVPTPHISGKIHFGPSHPLILEIARALIAHNGGPPKQNHLGLAIGHGSSSVAFLLMDHGIDPVGCTTGVWFGRTGIPLFLQEAGYRDVRLMREFLDRGIDVNTQCWRRCTALTIAAEYGHAACVRLLLERGADVTVVDGDGRTAWNMAADGKYEEVLELLRGTGAEKVVVWRSHLLDPFPIAPWPAPWSPLHIYNIDGHDREPWESRREKLIQD
ncbi:uncharacterized protein H6S33_004518 [Morchella sextelata]|uniref:uncharacterized protein n=1 Tax=Morchella sextelata TaxID=1174677 RepID=UPI001D03BB1F|nr:uncharacterized protein H6S33_004518 [Morchella sextelata]KAH0606061.1 hypothetical protein H6S33_004518 [Morchella sextelata]